MKSNSHAKKGFTLIELLVVVLILGILVSVALPSYLSAVNQSKVNSTNSNAKTVATAIQAAGVSAGTYPVGGDSVVLSNSTVLSNLGGVIPADPCNSSGAGTVTDWAITATATHATVAGAGSAQCGNAALTTYTVNL